MRLIFATCALSALGVAVAFGQTAPMSVPTSYTFTFTPEATDAIYAALERSSQVQSLVTGDRSPRLDALEAQIRQAVAEQKAKVAADAAEAAKKAADAAKAAEKPKEEPKKDEAKP